MSVKGIVMTAKDNVATVPVETAAGTEVLVAVDDWQAKVKASDKIPFAHKMAIKKIAKGEKIIKYGEVIGQASTNITAGQHVHVHNLDGCRGRGDLEKIK
jgi:altronate dehydratase small subunit